MEMNSRVLVEIFYICLSLDGHLAQLVQSTSFTPRGSGVRIPQRPHT